MLRKVHEGDKMRRKKKRPKMEMVGGGGGQRTPPSGGPPLEGRYAKDLASLIGKVIPGRLLESKKTADIGLAPPGDLR